MSSGNSENISERLYELLPQIYRLRDEQLPEDRRALKALMALIADQVADIEENLAQFYDDQFIETCAEWVVPYIGDLIGYRDIQSVADLFSSRSAVANTIAYRRRKGTAAVLEQLARDVTGWDAHAVEFFQRIVASQYLDHLRPNCTFAPDLRDNEALQLLGSAFDRVAHTVDVRCIEGAGGRYNIPNVGIFLWRLPSWPLTDTAVTVKDSLRARFNPLGIDTPLTNYPKEEDEISRLASRINTPFAVSRRDLHEDLLSGAPEIYGRSLVIRKDGDDVDFDQIVACCLADDPDNAGAWVNMPNDKIAVDPELGRIAFSTPQDASEISATFHYAFPAALGGGEYDRGDSIDSASGPLVVVPDDEPSLKAGIETLDGVGSLEIKESGMHSLPAATTLDAKGNLELRAANITRPVITLADELTVKADQEATLILSGLTFVGNAIRIPATATGLRSLRLVHCTLIPGLSLTESGQPQFAGQPSLVIESDEIDVEIDHCIMGAIRSGTGCRVRVSDSIIDAGSETNVAFSEQSGSTSGGRLHIESSTVIGKIFTKELEYASNTIFVSPVKSDQLQSGCARFSYVPTDSRVPRQFHCQPAESARKAVDLALEDNPDLSTEDQENLRNSISRRIKPVFTQETYGPGAYLQLASSCPVEIRTGADDESEMGVYHMLYQPQRESNLRRRLKEYLCVGLKAGIFFET